MLVPGVLFTAAGRVRITTSIGQVADFINQGFGFMNDGTLAVDAGPPAGEIYCKGFRLNASGAVYGTGAALATDVFQEGLRRGIGGDIAVESSDPVGFTSGNPITATPALSVG
jgi:hypothetical protein